METKKVYKAVTQEDPDGSGDLIINLPDELLNELGWKEGDVLNVDVEDGKILVKKQE